MKKVILWIFLFVGTIQLQSQVTADGRDVESTKPVFNLCFDETYQEYLQVIGTLDTSTLTVQDKLLFQSREYATKHHDYLNLNGNTTYETSVVSHNNMFSQWYKPPTLIRHDETGSKSYFAGNDPYYNGGWAGDYATGDLLQKYKIGSNGEKYYLETYTQEEAEDYAQQDSLNKAIGFLMTKIFAYPNDASLMKLSSAGYVIDQQTHFIKAQSNTEILIWDKQRKAIITQILENGAVISTSQEVYERLPHFNEYILTKTYIITPGRFSNGDSYETIEVIQYTNYAKNCNSNNAAKIATETSTDNVNIYPNPSLDHIQIDIPNSREETVLKISNISRQVMLERKLKTDTRTYKVKTKDFPPGMYIVHIQQGSQSYSSKFVKQ